MIYKVYPRKKDKNVVRIDLLLSFHIIERVSRAYPSISGNSLFSPAKIIHFLSFSFPNFWEWQTKTFFYLCSHIKNQDYIPFILFFHSTPRAPLAHPLQEELHNKRGIIYISHRNKPIESISYANLVEKACAPFKFKCPGLL